MRGEGFAFFHWRCNYPRPLNCSDRTWLSIWGDLQRSAFYRKQLARGKQK